MENDKCKIQNAKLRGSSASEHCKLREAVVNAFMRSKRSDVVSVKGYRCLPLAVI